MPKGRILFVNQSIYPYLSDNLVSRIGRYLPQKIQEKGREVRSFMPCYGHINERRNQLHEVIRLSGLNIIINDTDHQLIIKVASIQSARMQIYFIDNEDYFKRKSELSDESGSFFSDNDERAIFYSRGVLETAKKLSWSPDVVHCHGFISSFTPILVKKYYKDNPLFSNSKVVTSLYNDAFDGILDLGLTAKLKMSGLYTKDLKHFKEPTYINVMKSAIDNSDGVIIGEEKINPELEEYARNSGLPILDYHPESVYADKYNEFYEQFISEEEE